MDGLFTSLAAGLVVAMSVGTQGGAARYEAPAREEFDKRVTYPYVAGPERAGSIRKGSASLRRCMPGHEVRGLIGEPDFGLTIYMEGSKPKKPWISLWYYYLSKPERADGSSDSYVLVMLDGKQRLSAVSPHSADGIQRVDNSKPKVCE